MTKSSQTTDIPNYDVSFTSGIEFRKKTTAAEEALPLFDVDPYISLSLIFVQACAGKKIKITC